MERCGRLNCKPKINLHCNRRGKHQLKPLTKAIILDVLHVDDDPAILALVNRALAKRGYTTHSLPDPSQVLAWLSKQATQIVILDIQMPGKGGLELLQEIKKFDGGIQVIMLTGLVTIETINRASRLGADECFFKPMEDLDLIADAVDRAKTKKLHWWSVLRELRAREKTSCAAATVQS